jgi:pyridoxine 5-phosphate synthase
MTDRLRLGVNIDHVATIRNARGGRHPDPVRAAKLAEAAGADGITAHLREDRRHISDRDIERLSREIALPLNLEMAPTDEMVAIALQHRPHAACIVPEKREERTTEGGIDVAGQRDKLAPIVRTLREAKIRVSLFLEPDAAQLEAAVSLGAPVVELHTGAYCDAAERGDREARMALLERIRSAARHGARLGLEMHAGHGLGYDTVGPVAAMPEFRELNIGRGDLWGAGCVNPAHAPGHRRCARREGGIVIIGLGSDLIDIRRIEKSIARFGDRFLARIFTAAERTKSDRRAQRAASYAKRFAAKEACSKALGTGLRRGVFWRDMGVVNLPGGKPSLRLTGGALRRLEEITPPGHKAQIDLTITDDFPLAQAIVVISAVAAGPQAAANA